MAVLSVLAPLLYLLSSWSSVDQQLWQHLLDTQLGRLTFNTLVLIAGVGVGVLLLGVSLAWFTSVFEFPGRGWLDWALMLPLAVPAYVLAFVMLGIFDFGGPVQATLRDWIGSHYSYVDVRQTWVVITVMSLVLYPYVYLLARTAFVAQGRDVLEASRSLGCGPVETFFRVALPMARPAIVAGLSLALMETLADFGTVAVFNYETFTTAIYKSWFGFFSLQAGAQLASVLLLFVAVSLLAERGARGSARFTQSDIGRARFRRRLPGYKGWVLSAYACLVLAAAFAIPLLQLLFWVVADTAHLADRRFWGLLWRSLFLASAAALLTVGLGLLLALVRRQSRGYVRLGLGVVNLGYALPGSVLAVGIVMLLADVDRYAWMPLVEMGGWQLQPLTGSIFALMFAYWVRFVAVASGPLDSGLERITPAISEVARSLGVSRWRLIWQIILPMLRPGVLTAMVLVFVDVLKEMPATLLLRPYGWDTLAVRIYAMTSEGEWQWAAMPALTLVLAGLVPVYLLMRSSTSPQ
ncbi:MAG: iron(III) transport system permease protein [Halieaceae bacterium]